MSDHLKVYEEFVIIVTMENAKQRMHQTSKLITTNLRDVKFKPGSGGKTGKKQEMADGTIKEFSQIAAIS